MFIKKLDGFNFYLSPKKNKKYRVFVNNKAIDFGDKRYEQFYDKIGFYHMLNHYNKIRRNNYRKRASKIKNSKGEYSYKIPNNANYFSYKYLW